MKYDIRLYGDPALRRKSVPIPKVSEDIRRLAKDMLATMYKANGLGLAAEQIGREESICVIDVPPSHDVREEGGPRDNPGIPMPLVLLNPRIVREEGEQSGQEGCLSFPEIFVKIVRAEEVTVSYTDLSGAEQSICVRGLLARTVQHELDHLDGVLLRDRMSAAQKLANAGKLKRLKKKAEAGE